MEGESLKPWLQSGWCSHNTHEQWTLVAGVGGGASREFPTGQKEALQRVPETGPTGWKGVMFMDTAWPLVLTPHGPQHSYTDSHRRIKGGAQLTRVVSLNCLIRGLKQPAQSPQLKWTQRKGTFSFPLEKGKPCTHSPVSTRTLEAGMNEWLQRHWNPHGMWWVAMGLTWEHRTHPLEIPTDFCAWAGRGWKLVGFKY